jgi:hypothetical protein
MFEYYRNVLKAALGMETRAADISGLVGEVVQGIEQAFDSGEVTAVYFITDRAIWRMYHDQACSESVYLEDVNGDLAGLIGQRIVAAEESSSDNHDDPRARSSETWTFYKLAAENGVYVTLRWWGSSNGYYSEDVDVERYPPECIRAPIKANDGPSNHRKLKRLWRQYGGGKAA